MTLGVGVFNTPNKLANLGLVQGALYFLGGVLLTYYTFQIIFEAADTTNKNNFMQIVEELMGPVYKRILNVTLIVDYSCSLVFYSLFVNDLYVMLLKEFKIFDIPNSPYDPFNIKLRGLFYLCYYLLISHLLFKKNITSFKLIPKLFLASIILLLTVLLILFAFFT
jgi:amino acid permease